MRLYQTTLVLIFHPPFLSFCNRIPIFSIIKKPFFMFLIPFYILSILLYYLLCPTLVCCLCALFYVSSGDMLTSEVFDLRTNITGTKMSEIILNRHLTHWLNTSSQMIPFFSNNSLSPNLCHFFYFCFNSCHCFPLVSVWVCVYACACICMCVHRCMCVCVCVCL